MTKTTPAGPPDPAPAPAGSPPPPDPAPAPDVVDPRDGRGLGVIDQPAPADGSRPGYHPPPPGFMSAGVAADIEMYGETTDPNTGQKLTREDLPK